MLIPPGVEFAVRGDIKRSVDRTFLRALADLLRFKTLTDQQPQRIKDDRLTGPGFTG
jgi:hypothetical protein